MDGVKWLLDTSLVIGLLNEDPAAVVIAKQHSLQIKQTAISQITRMELLGFPKITDTGAEQIQSFMGDCHVSLLDEAVEQQAIRLRRAGSLKLLDAIIAATAQVHQLTLLTLDKRLSKAISP